MYKSKKIYFAVVLVIILVLNTSASVFAAASKYGPYYVRPANTGDFGGFVVDLDSGQSSFSFTDYKVYGLHSGEEALIKWTISDLNTNEDVLTFFKGDVTTSSDFMVTGLKSGGTYSVSWESMNNYDVVGGTYITVYGTSWQ